MHTFRSIAFAGALVAVPALAQQLPASALPPPVASQAVSVADAFRKLNADTWVARSVT